ncbi:hypothetical protein HYW21_04325 [Candidatus Woesearchaeota archaeon]|nr:hypothetical protein [Candidatus Woesearchaeota archaeon]
MTIPQTIMIKNTDKRSQISLDLLIVLGVSLIVFLIILSLVFQRNITVEAGKTRLYAKAVADRVAHAITAVARAGHGTEMILSLSPTLGDSTPYEIQVYPSAHRVQISWYSHGEQQTYSAPLTTANITGTVNTSRDLIITNNAGGVSLTW